MNRPKLLTLRFLGEIEASRGETRLALPPSKKTRALLAYLALAGRPQRRERLCAFLWDVPDDPRGALRWSLTKLRAIVDEPGRTRLVANRDSVGFDDAGTLIDVVRVHERLVSGIDALSTSALLELLREFRGAFLEGLELPDFQEWQAWCVAQREDARLLQVRIVRALVERLDAEPEKALPHARTLAQIDPLEESSHAALLRLLLALGRRQEAEQQYRATTRLFAELGSASTGLLESTWQRLRTEAPASGAAGAIRVRADTVPMRADASPVRTDAVPVTPPSPPPAATSAEPPPMAQTSAHTPWHPEAPVLVGRETERSRLHAALAAVATERRERIVLVTGEPGIGKTRLLAELVGPATERHGTVLDGCSYEAETGRPYGPWIDALRRLPAVTVGKTLGNELAPLLPEFGLEPRTDGTRERLFGAVVELLAARAHSAPPVVLLLDDVQWIDAASAELLHYVVRMHRHRPILVALAARSGEFADNTPIVRVLRRLRREVSVEEIELGPLSPGDTTRLVQQVAPSVDGERVHAECAGNPLFALEVARSLPHRRDDISHPLAELVRERIERLSPASGDVLRWGAVLGPSFTMAQLRQHVALSEDELVTVLETLERHALLRSSTNLRQQHGAYTFAHGVVRRAVYAELSEPRRRLMHGRVAQALEQECMESQCAPGTRAAGAAGMETLAAEIAHHAALAGDAGLAARACVAAGRRCLRLFANGEAEALARRGIHYARELPESERVQRLLELLQVSIAARRPSDLDAAACTIEELSERALDLGSLECARLGFHMLSYLRWEEGDWSSAQQGTLRAADVSRAADEKEQVVAMAEAARCLALLERDLGQAETLLLEARALAERLDLQPVAIPDAIGMLRLHQGQLEEAERLFQQALALARRGGDHADEFQVLEHLVAVELERGRFEAACALSNELVRIGEKMRAGSEAPFARALASLCRYSRGVDDAPLQFEEALAALRAADAKHRLAFTLTRAASVDLQRGEPARARARAEEALRAAQLLPRASEIALARVALGRAAAALADPSEVRRQTEALHREGLHNVAVPARRAVGDFLAEYVGTPSQEGGR